MFASKKDIHCTQKSTEKAPPKANPAGENGISNFFGNRPPPNGQRPVDGQI